MLTEIPYSALGGGALIGLAAALLLLVNGRHAGISGIAAGILSNADGERGWRLGFLAGLLLSSVVFRELGGVSRLSLDAPFWLMAVSGLLVGFGTRLGGGCTSGHGVCGLARGSVRSLVATAVFMLTAAVVVFVCRHVFKIGFL